MKFLSTLFGGPPIAMHYGYVVSEPGHPGIMLHCDGQPWGSSIFGHENTCPRLVRVLYMLDDLDTDVAPFKCVPGSHLSYHEDGNPVSTGPFETEIISAPVCLLRSFAHTSNQTCWTPACAQYLRYAEHPAQVKVMCRKGSAVLINQNISHGNFPNHGEWRRRMLAIAYRPDWAGPMIAVGDWDPVAVEQTPPAVQAVLRDRSQRIFNPFGGNKRKYSCMYIFRSISFHADTRSSPPSPCTYMQRACLRGPMQLCLRRTTKRRSWRRQLGSGPVVSWRDYHQIRPRGEVRVMRVYR